VYLPVYFSNICSSRKRGPGNTPGPSSQLRVSSADLIIRARHNDHGVGSLNYPVRVDLGKPGHRVGLPHVHQLAFIVIRVIGHLQRCVFGQVDLEVALSQCDERRVDQRNLAATAIPRRGPTDNDRDSQDVAATRAYVREGIRSATVSVQADADCGKRVGDEVCGVQVPAELGNQCRNVTAWVTGRCDLGSPVGDRGRSIAWDTAVGHVDECLVPDIHQRPFQLSLQG